MGDKYRLDWLESITRKGICPALVNDDNGHWAVAFSGIQNLPDGDGPEDIQTTFFIETERWKDSIRKAIDYAMEEE